AHALLQGGNMAGRRVHTRADLDRAGRLHAEALGKVDQIRMVADKLHTAERRGLTLPTGDSGVKRLEVGREIFLEDRLVLRVITRQAVRHGPGHSLAGNRIEVDMRVPSRVLVTERTVNAVRHFEGGNVDGAVNIAW